MIFQQIKAHEEPAPVSYSSGASTLYGTKTPAEEAVWKLRYENDLQIARNTYDIGDTVGLMSNSASRFVITGFVEDFEKVISYMGDPCIILARNPSWSSSNSTNYALKELNTSSLIKIGKLQQEASNDE